MYECTLWASRQYTLVAGLQLPGCILVAEEVLTADRALFLWQPQGEHNPAHKMVLETSGGFTAYENLVYQP